MPVEPMKIEVHGLADYLAGMSMAVFQSGMNWAVIQKKWDGMKAAFDDFDPETVAAYSPADVDRLMSDTRIIRNRKKVESIVANAGEIIVVDREFGGFKEYLESFGDNDLLVKDLHKRFSFLGPTVAHIFLFTVGHDPEAQRAWAFAQFGPEAAAKHHRA
jgi:DNA-3-methyladenine glycosylase I